MGQGGIHHHAESCILATDLLQTTRGLKQLLIEIGRPWRCPGNNGWRRDLQFVMGRLRSRAALQQPLALKISKGYLDIMRSIIMGNCQMLLQTRCYLVRIGGFRQQAPDKGGSAVQDDQPPAGLVI